MTRRQEHSWVSRRLAYGVITVVFANYLGNAFLYVLDGGPTPARIVIALACLFAIGYLQLRVFSRPGTDLRSAKAYLALAALALLVFVPVPFFPIAAWGGMAVFLAGSALLVLPGRVRWVVFGAVSLANAAIRTGHGVPTGVLGYYAASPLVAGLAVYGLSRLPTLVKQLESARSELAGLAVSQERLGFARDLQELLGFSLATITLRAGLARDMIGDRTAGALAEITQVLGIAREALANVRAVASSYRELSLADEIDSARSVLTAGGVTTTVEVDDSALSPRSRTELAKVLRDGVTNVLRYSDATRCSITISGTGRIDIVSDGAPSPDGKYRLHAEVPALPEAERPRSTGAPIPTRFAQVLLTAVVIGYGVMATLLASYDPATSLAELAICAASCAGIAALVLGIVSRPPVPSRPKLGYAALAGIAACVFVPQFVFQDPYLGGVPGFLAGAAALVLPRWPGWAGFVVIVAGQGVIHTAFDSIASDVVWSLMATTNHGLVLYALTRLRSMVTELHEAREELATAAVTQERLRFARDLHDLLGYSLSAITLKTELTHRLATLDPGRARQELTEVLEISRQALADVRSVALSYRELALDEETRSAQALLAAADIEVTVRIDAYQLPKEAEVALATVLREGVTNLLRHSKAEHCEIVLSSSPHLVRMDIVNDGIPTIERKSRDGNGIGNLTSRVRALGGDLHAGLTPEHTYRLRAEIPLPVTASR